MVDFLFRNKKPGGCKKGIMVALAALLALVAAAVWLLFVPAQAGQSGPAKWKNFSEKTYGFSIDYPFDWNIAADYDRYGAGLMSVEIDNKKCGLTGQCGGDCVDIRALIGKIPATGSTPGLFTQLYEDYLMVRDFSAASLIGALDFGQKKVFKIADENPTLALNGKCPGPLYVFETKAGYFVYVFTGLGANAAKTVDAGKIIGSIEVAGQK